MCMKCIVVKDGDYWVINGLKNWIIYGLFGDVVVVLICMGELLDLNGIIVFIIEKGIFGFLVVKIKDKLGVCVLEIVELIFENVCVYEL